MREAVIVSAVRTPVGKFQGSLQSFSSPQLGALVVQRRLPPVAYDKLGDHDGDLTLGPVDFDLQDVVHQRHQDEAIW